MFSGAPFRAVLPVPADQIKVLGTPKVYVKVAASGNHRAQAFCGECGTQLYATEPEQPMVLNIRLGCVNERAQLSPTLQIWQESAMPWLGKLSVIPSRIRGSSSSLAGKSRSTCAKHGRSNVTLPP